MKLYTKAYRNSKRPAYPNEPTYSYYDQSGRLDIAMIRELHESWFSLYPDGADKLDLQQRFKTLRAVNTTAQFSNCLSSHC